MPGMTRLLLSTSPMMRGDDVLAVQRRLAAAGAAVTQDGLYGEGTASAVRGFQVLQGLEVDGIVGPLTWAALFQEAGAPPPSLPQDPLASTSLADLLAPHGYYRDGCSWRLGIDGIEVINNEGLIKFSGPERTQALNVLTRYRQELISALASHLVPIELVVACICAESGGQPPVRPRLEPGCDRDNPENTPSRVSEGLMQTLLSTARSVLRQPGLRLEELRRPEISILAGTAYMAQQSHQTRHDPPLVAAAYNAGSIRYNASDANRWRLLQYPIGTSNHVDRFLRAFNAAMGLMATVEFPAQIPSLRRMLQGGSSPAGASPPAAPSLAAAAANRYVAVEPERWADQVVETGQCVAYVQVACKAPHTSHWRRGGLVKGDASVPPGTAIATFDPDETYGNHTDGRSHAAIYVKQDEHGLTVYDQWVGQPVHQRVIRFNGDRSVDDGNAFFVIA